MREEVPACELHDLGKDAVVASSAVSGLGEDAVVVPPAESSIDIEVENPFGDVVPRPRCNQPFGPSSGAKEEYDVYLPAGRATPTRAERFMQRMTSFHQIRALSLTVSS